MILYIGLFVLWAVCGVALYDIEQRLMRIERQQQMFDRVLGRKKPSLAMEDLLILAGSEGDNLPKTKIDIKSEVAEQLGCDGITFPD